MAERAGIEDEDSTLPSTMTLFVPEDTGIKQSKHAARSATANTFMFVVFIVDVDLMGDGSVREQHRLELL